MGGRRRGAGGRFERDGEGGAEGERPCKPAGPVERIPQPQRCRMYVRKRVARALPGMVKVLIERAMRGSVPHMALLIKTAGFDHRSEPTGPAKKREKGLEQILREQWERDRVQREADEAADAARFAS